MRDKPEKRICGKCNKKKLFTAEFFPVHKRQKWGLDTICRECTCARARVVNKEERQRLRIEVLTAYSPDKVLGCCCCGESQPEFLTLDHIDGGGCKERKKYPATMLFRRLRREEFPEGYRTLCYNCNNSYGMYGYCPHEREK